jgi:hypothetical protein
VATFSTVACVTQQRAINTRTAIVACMFRGFCASARLAWDKHATIYTKVPTVKGKVVPVLN